MFAEVGHALHDVPTLPIFFQVLSDVLLGEFTTGLHLHDRVLTPSLALTFLYIGNWVHRDISTGNIIVIAGDSGGVAGKLSDLEYAKEFGSNSISSDPKTV